MNPFNIPYVFPLYSLFKQNNKFLLLFISLLLLLVIVSYKLNFEYFQNTYIIIYFLICLSHGIYNGIPSKSNLQLSLSLILIVSIIFSISTGRFTEITHPLGSNIGTGVLSSILVILSLTEAKKNRLDYASLLVGALSLITSASRTGFICMAFMLIAYYLFSKRFIFPILMIILSLGFVVSHPESLNASGRNFIWYTALNSIRDNYLFGIGPYQSSTLYVEASSRCELWPSLRDIGIQCPSFIESLGQPWLITHNIFLQLLADVGVVGMTAFIVLISISLSLLINRGDRVLSAIYIGIISSNIFDNTISLPSIGYSELFWIISGYSLSHINGDAINKVSNKSYIFSSIIIFTIVFTPPSTLIKHNKNRIRSAYISYGYDEINKVTRIHLITDGIMIIGSNYYIYTQACASMCKNIRKEIFKYNGQLSKEIVAGYKVSSDENIKVLVFPYDQPFYNINPTAIGVSHEN